jgi:hypothetical protein
LVLELELELDELPLLVLEPVFDPVLEPVLEPVPESWFGVLDDDSRNGFAELPPAADCRLRFMLPLSVCCERLVLILLDEIAGPV